MAICSANMDDCNKKAKCIFGPNEGQAYNPLDPCCGNGEFNSETCDCESAKAYRKWAFYLDYYGPVTENGNKCCEGYTLSSVSKISTARDFGTPVFMRGSSRLGNTKKGYIEAEGPLDPNPVEVLCRPDIELTYADAGYDGFFVNDGPFGSFGGWVATDEKVYQEAGSEGGVRSRVIITAETLDSVYLCMNIATCGSGAVNCVVPDCFQAITAVPIGDEGEIWDEAVSV